MPLFLHPIDRMIDEVRALKTPSWAARVNAGHLRGHSRDEGTRNGHWGVQRRSHASSLPILPSTSFLLDPSTRILPRGARTCASVRAPAEATYDRSSGHPHPAPHPSSPSGVTGDDRVIRKGSCY